MHSESPANQGIVSYQVHKGLQIPESTLVERISLNPIMDMEVTRSH